MVFIIFGDWSQNRVISSTSSSAATMAWNACRIDILYEISSIQRMYVAGRIANDSQTLVYGIREYMYTREEGEKAQA